MNEHTAATMELQILGNYRLVAPLRTSSPIFRMYLACHQDDPEGVTPTYLVKLWHPNKSPEHELVKAQFHHEVTLLSAFNHPSIPAAHSHGVHQGIHYVVLDYVDGVDLATLLGHRKDQPQALAKEIAVYILGQLSDAVNYIHTFEELVNSHEVRPLEIVHRDICPNNILISRRGNIFLTDFGSAISVLLAKEHTMQQAGTKAYMAPERIIGVGPATVRSDLFSIAVVLWEILKGQRCFKAEDDLKTMDAIVRFDISHSGRRVSGLSTKLGDILRKNLDRDPARRYVSAYQMLQRLAQTPEAAAAERSRNELAMLVNKAMASLHA